MMLVIVAMWHRCHIALTVNKDQAKKQAKTNFTVPNGNKCEFWE